jgi:hypothetical protein
LTTIRKDMALRSSRDACNHATNALQVALIAKEDHSAQRISNDYLVTQSGSFSEQRGANKSDVDGSRIVQKDGVSRHG